MTSLGSTVDDDDKVTSLMKPETASMMLRSLGGCEGTVSGPPDRTCRGDSADIFTTYHLVIFKKLYSVKSILGLLLYSMVHTEYL